MKNTRKDKAGYNGGVRGHGNPNKILIHDFATGEYVFKVETEMPKTKENAKEFQKLVALLKSKEADSRATRLAIVKILHDEVTGTGASPEDQKDAKNMFSSAFGLSPEVAPKKKKNRKK